MTLRLAILAAAFLCLLSSAASAHDAPLDRLGCHTDAVARNYHCHVGPLAGRSFAGRAEALDALRRQQAADHGRPIGETPRGCCIICREGKPCGDICLPADQVCRRPAGCACNAMGR